MKALTSDPTTLAGVFQALATVVAVLFGWGLSVLTERRGWRRRKAEQVREKQLHILAQVVMDFRTGLTTVDQVEQILNELTEVNVGAIDDKARTLLERDAQARLNELQVRLGTVVTQVEAQEMVLRLLGFGKAGLVKIESALAPLRRLARERVGSESVYATLSALTEEVREGVSAFVHAGAIGLSS